MKLSKKLLWPLTMVILTISGGELFARFYLGLGSPPLFMTDSKIEYLLKPDQNVYRFGNHIITNNYGMRSKPFPLQSNKNELRVMVFGDSILNGGSFTDHADLATTTVQKKLNELKIGNAVVGNISAASWGPGNWLAYAKKYKLFNADIVILVISSHDYADNPSFVSLNPNTHPTKIPFSALTEGIMRYLPRYFSNFSSSKDTSKIYYYKEPTPQKITKGLQDLSSFLTLVKNNVESVFVVQHWERDEVMSEVAKEGNMRISEICEKLGILSVQLLPYFKESIQNGYNPYRDNIHINKTGQQLIAKAILENLPNKALQRTSR